MARQRAYRHDVRCPACGSNWMPKHGTAQGRQGLSLRRLPALSHPRCRLHPAQRRRPGTRPGLVPGGRFVERHCAPLWRNPAGGEPVGQKGGRAALSRLRRRGQQRTTDPAGRPPAAVIAFDEMWTDQQARRGAQRQELWIWTAVVAEPDGRRWADFAVGDRSENTFQELYARLPEAELYRSDAYAVYQSWLPPGGHVVHLLNEAEGRGELERGRPDLYFHRRGCGTGWCGGRKGTPKALRCWCIRWPCCWRIGPQNPIPVYVNNAGYAGHVAD